MKWIHYFIVKGFTSSSLSLASWLLWILSANSPGFIEIWNAPVIEKGIKSFFLVARFVTFLSLTHSRTRRLLIHGLSISLHFPSRYSPQLFTCIFLFWYENSINFNFAYHIQTNTHGNFPHQCLWDDYLLYGFFEFIDFANVYNKTWK